MALRCPRDGSELVPERRVDGTFEIDRCDRCGGIWLDAAELSALCPMASHLPRMREEVLIASELEDDSATFPCIRCGGRGLEEGTDSYDVNPPELAIRPFRLVDLVIDFCLACGGIWLDDNEVREIVRDPPKDIGEVAKRPASPFRQSALELAATGSTLCHLCKEPVEKSRLFASAAGFFCVSCYGPARSGASSQRSASTAPSDAERPLLSQVAAVVAQALGSLAGHARP